MLDEECGCAVVDGRTDRLGLFLLQKGHEFEQSLAVHSAVFVTPSAVVVHDLCAVKCSIIVCAQLRRNGSFVFHQQHSLLTTGKPAALLGHGGVANPRRAVANRSQANKQSSSADI